jgi:hypothetical protein
MGQEGQEGAGHQHREDVAEIGAGGHLNVLEHVGEGAAPLQHAFLQHHQALFQQDDPGFSIRPASAYLKRVSEPKNIVSCQRSWPTRASPAPGRPSCAQLLARMFNPGCDCGAQPALTMGFAPSRVLMENPG